MRIGLCSPARPTESAGSIARSEICGPPSNMTKLVSKRLAARGSTEAEANALINLVYDYTLVGDPGKSYLQPCSRVDSLFDRELWNRWRFYDIRQQAASAEYWLAGRHLDRAEEYARRLLANARTLWSSEVSGCRAPDSGGDCRSFWRSQYGGRTTNAFR